VGLAILVLTATGSFKALAMMSMALGSVLALFQSVVNFSIFFTDADATGASKDPLLFASRVVLAVPTIVSPVKMLPAESLVPLIAPVSDVAFRTAGAALIIADTVTHWHS
jgi:hypothetical protein